MSDGFKIELSALGKMVSEQLIEQGLVSSKHNLDVWDGHHRALIRLMLHGYISERVTKRAHEKLAREIAKNVTREEPRK